MTARRLIYDPTGLTTSRDRHFGIFATILSETRSNIRLGEDQSGMFWVTGETVEQSSKVKERVSAGGERGGKRESRHWKKAPRARGDFWCRIGAGEKVAKSERDKEKEETEGGECQTDGWEEGNQRAAPKRKNAKQGQKK